MNNSDFEIRQAAAVDVPLILSFIRQLAEYARERKCGRFEWSVLDWNEPAINFYKSLGAAPLKHMLKPDSRVS